jgi:hypothetical protein
MCTLGSVRWGEEGMDEGDAQRAPRADATRPSMGLGPVARPAIPPRRDGPGGRPPLPRTPAQGSVPVGPAAIPTRSPGPGTTAWGTLGRAAPQQGTRVPRTGFGLPSMRRNVCPHFYMTGIRGSVPIQAAHLIKALVRQEHTVSRCQVRGGVHMEQGYVNDVCLGSRFNQCVFYEDELTRE